MVVNLMEVNMRCMKYYALISFLLLLLSGCSSLGLTNEDAGHSVLASDVSVPANGSVVYTVERNPRTSIAARRWSKENGVSRSLFSWFGFKDGPEVNSGGEARTHGGANGS